MPTVDRFWASWADGRWVSMRGALRRLLLLGLVACGREPASLEMRTDRLLDERGFVPPLVCPGAAGCERAEARFQAGAAARLITPAVDTWLDLNRDGDCSPGEPFRDADQSGGCEPTWLAGHERGRAAAAVHDPLWARALSLRKGDLRIVVVTLDLLGLLHEDVLRIRKAVAERAVGVDQVVVTASYVHSGPDTLGLFGPSPERSGRNERYVDLVVERATDAVVEAVLAEAPADLRVGEIDGTPLVRDVRRPQVIDGAIRVLELTVLGGRPLAVVVIWASVPETLGEDRRVVSADFVDALRAEIERARPRSRAFFWPGSLGGRTTPFAWACQDPEENPDCLEAIFAYTSAVGAVAAEWALLALDRPQAFVVPDPTLALRRVGFLVPGDNLELSAALATGVLPRRAVGADGDDLQDGVEPGGAWQIHTEVNLLRLGPLKVLFAPGAVYPELWLSGVDGESLVERPDTADFPEAEVDPPLQTLLLGGLPLLVSQANDAIGPILPKAQFDREEPRGEGARAQPDEALAIGPEVGRSFVDAVRTLMSLEPR